MLRDADLLAAWKSFSVQPGPMHTARDISCRWESSLKQKASRSLPTSTKNEPITMFIFCRSAAFSRSRMSSLSTRVTSQTCIGRKARSCSR